MSSCVRVQSEEALLVQQPLGGGSRPKSGRSGAKLGKGGNPVGRALAVVRTLLTGASTILPPWAPADCGGAADADAAASHGSGPAMAAARVVAGVDGTSAIAAGVVARREIGAALHALCEALLGEAGAEDTKALKSLGKVRRRRRLRRVRARAHAPR
jgi:hypothetical protein